MQAMVAECPQLTCVGAVGEFGTHMVRFAVTCCSNGDACHSEEDGPMRCTQLVMQCKVGTYKSSCIGMQHHSGQSVLQQSQDNTNDCWDDDAQ